MSCFVSEAAWVSLELISAGQRADVVNLVLLISTNASSLTKAGKKTTTLHLQVSSRYQKIHTDKGILTHKSITTSVKLK